MKRDNLSITMLVSKKY